MVVRTPICYYATPYPVDVLLYCGTYLLDTDVVLTTNYSGIVNFFRVQLMQSVLTFLH